MKTSTLISMRNKCLSFPSIANLTLVIFFIFSIENALAYESDLNSFQQQQRSRGRSLPQVIPRKIGYSIPTKSVRTGQTINIEIFLLDNENRRIRAPREYRVVAKIKNSSEPPKEVIISAGSENAYYQHRSNNRGVIQIEFSHPELLSATPFISIGSTQNDKSSNYRLVSLQPSGGGVTIVAPKWVNDRIFKADGIDYAELNVYLDGTLPSDAETIKLIFSCSRCRVNPMELSLSNSNRLVTTRITSSLANIVEVHTNNVSSSTPVINDTTEIRFSPAIDRFRVELDNNSLIELFQEGSAKITLLNKEGQRIATDTTLDVSIFNLKGKTEWEPEDGVKIESQKRDANLTLWPIFPDSVEMRFSILDYNDQIIKARVNWPWRTLTFSIIFGLLGGFLYVISEKYINKKRASRWRIVIGSVSGIFLYLVLVYFRFVPSFFKGSIHSLGLVFIICTIGGWLGPKVFEIVGNFVSGFLNSAANPVHADTNKG